jgi:hypothetical protein
MVGRQQLLELNPDKRLGSGETDALEIKKHPFFADVDFDAVYNKKIPPTYFPNVKNAMDTSSSSSPFHNFLRLLLHRRRLTDVCLCWNRLRYRVYEREADADARSWPTRPEGPRGVPRVLLYVSSSLFHASVVYCWSSN